MADVPVAKTRFPRRGTLRFKRPVSPERQRNYICRHIRRLVQVPSILTSSRNKYYLLKSLSLSRERVLLDNQHRLYPLIQKSQSTTYDVSSLKTDRRLCLLVEVLLLSI